MTHSRPVTPAAVSRHASARAIAGQWRNLCEGCASDCRKLIRKSGLRVIGPGPSSGNLARQAFAATPKLPQREHHHHHHHQLPITAPWRRHWSAPSLWPRCPRRLPSATRRPSSSSPPPSMLCIIEACPDASRLTTTACSCPTQPHRSQSHRKPRPMFLERSRTARPSLTSSSNSAASHLPTTWTAAQRRCSVNTWAASRSRSGQLSRSQTCWARSTAMPSYRIWSRSVDTGRV